MTFTPAFFPPLAVLPEYPALGESLAFQLNGLIVVFLALGSIWALLELMGLFFRRQGAREIAAAAHDTQAPEASAVGELSPEILAVIAAAVATVVKQPHRIKQVAAESPSRDWAREGRREIFDSHKIR